MTHKFALIELYLRLENDAIFYAFGLESRESILNESLLILVGVLTGAMV